MSLWVGVRIGANASEVWDNKDRRVNTRHTEVHKVVMTTGAGLSGSLDYEAREDEVALVSGLPWVGINSTILPGAWCIERSFDEVDPAVWEVTCVFDNSVTRAEDGANSETGEPIEPWDLTPEWEWGSESLEVPLLKDAEDPTIAITNSAGEPLPPTTTQIAIPILTIRRAEKPFNPAVITTYTNKRNSTTFWDAGEGKVLCSGITAQPAKKDTFKYWNVTYTFKFKMDEDGWDFYPLDEGHYYLGIGDIKIPFGDDAFQQIVGNLDGSGFINTSGIPAFAGPYHRYDKANFNTLDLGPWTWA